jgi:hypothetical protein
MGTFDQHRLIRHPGESRDPTISVKTPDIRHPLTWVPAFAGMTKSA